MNKRRKLIVAIGAGALATPPGSFAQQPAKMYRIGFLSSESPSSYRTRLEALRAGRISDVIAVAETIGTGTFA